MKIVAHRGHWNMATEKNSAGAFARALAGGFGIETDLRDVAGTVVISHDMPRGGEMTLDQFLILCKRYPGSRPLALNIKADGLQAPVGAALQRHAILDAFVFDMAVPDALGYLKTAIPTYSRSSEYEDPPPFFEQAAGIWLDAFHGQWYQMDVIEGWLAQGKAVCIVSPELHGRPHLPLWHSLCEAHLQQHASLCLCTDFPVQAYEVFHAQN